MNDMYMSNQTTQLWKHGTRGNNIEFANIKLLEKQEPSTYKLISEWREGFTVNDANYQYFVGKSQYGYWLSRKRLPVFIPETQQQPPLTIHKGIVTGGNESKAIEISPTKTVQNGHIGIDIDVDKPSLSLSLNAEEINILKAFCAMVKRFQ